MYSLIDSNEIQEIWEQMGLNHCDFNENQNQEAQLKPRRFKAVLLHFSQEKEDLDKALQEWKSFGHPEEHKEPEHCICSQIIHNSFWVKHKKTYTFLRIGCDCIMKFWQNDLEMINSVKDLKRKQDYQKKYKKQSKLPLHRFCSGCKRHAIDINESEEKTLCHPCWKKQSLQKRSCIECGDACINMNEPEWKKLCYSCWMKKQSSQNRSCEDCGHISINIKEPEWKKLCFSCWKKKTNPTIRETDLFSKRFCSEIDESLEVE